MLFLYVVYFKNLDIVENVYNILKRCHSILFITNFAIFSKALQYKNLYFFPQQCILTYRCIIVINVDSFS